MRPSGAKADGSALLDAGIAMWMRRAAGARTVAFCANVAASRELAARLRDADVPAVHMDGTTPADERRRMLADLHEGEVRVLCNVDVASEGFDEPLVECVLLLRPLGDEGLRLYIQQVGRALRVAPGKARCVVLDCIGATHRFGPITGPPASDYAFEDSAVCALGRAKGKAAAAAAAAVRRCTSCGNLRHRDLLTCPACAEAKRAAPTAPAVPAAAATTADADADADASRPSCASRPSVARPPLAARPVNLGNIASSVVGTPPASPKPAAKPQHKPELKPRFRIPKRGDKERAAAAQLAAEASERPREAAASEAAAEAEDVGHTVVPAAPPVELGATAAEPELREAEVYKGESGEDEGLQDLMAGLTGLRLQADAGPGARARA